MSESAAELRCAFETCVLANRSDLATLRASGPDFLGLLHRLSTGDVRGLVAGSGAETVLTSPKGRIVERLFVHHLGAEGVLVVAGPGSGPRVLDHIRRFTFAENTGLSEITETMRLLVLSGPRAGEALVAAGLEPPAPLGVWAGSLAGIAIHVLGADGLSSAGFAVLLPAAARDAVERHLASAVAAVGGRVTDREVLEAYRVLRGLPAAGHELTPDYNPLEAGLWSAVSFDKGCYVGQEVVARLRTYDKVSRVLVGLKLSEAGELPLPGSTLRSGARAIGALTSAVRPPGREPVGLGYVKRRESRAGMELHVGGAEGGATARLAELPFE